MHLDVDAFFPSVEQARLPFLAGRPVVVGSGVIASCSYEARGFGLHAGMALHEARKLCPHAVYLAGDSKVYRSFADRVWELCREISPAVDSYLDDAYLDMTGTHRIYPDARTAASFLKKTIRNETGLRATIGIGPSRVTARMAGAEAKPDGLCMVAEHEIERFLANMPIRKLPGVGSRTAARLGLLGVRTVAEMRALPLDGLVALFGKNGETLHARSRGQDGRVLHKKEIPRTISRETTFHKATSNPDEIRSMVYYLIERGMRTVRQLGLKARTLGLRIAYSDWVVKNNSRTAPEPFDLERSAFGLAMELLRSLHTRRVSLRRAGVKLSNLVRADGEQCLLFVEKESGRHGRVARAVDAVRARFGFNAVVAGPSVGLMNTLERDEHGYILRTPSLTK